MAKRPSLTAPAPAPDASGVSGRDEETASFSRTKNFRQVGRRAYPGKGFARSTHSKQRGGENTLLIPPYFFLSAFICVKIIVVASSPHRPSAMRATTLILATDAIESRVRADGCLHRRAIMLVAPGFNVLGDGLRDLWNLRRGSAGYNSSLRTVSPRLNSDILDASRPVSPIADSSAYRCA